MRWEKRSAKIRGAVTDAKTMYIHKRMRIHAREPHDMGTAKEQPCPIKDVWGEQKRSDGIKKGFGNQGRTLALKQAARGSRPEQDWDPSVRTLLCSPAPSRHWAPGPSAAGRECRPARGVEATASGLLVCFSILPLSPSLDFKEETAGIGNWPQWQREQTQISKARDRKYIF